MRHMTPTDFRDLLKRNGLRQADAAYLAGVRGTKESYGDMIAFRPYGACVVMFVTYS